MTVIRKIRNKRRCGFRGKKMRYSVWRAKYNQMWGRAYEVMARRICDDNDLNVEDHISTEERNTWDHTYRDLRDKGYNMIGVSIKQMIGDSGLIDEVV